MNITQPLSGRHPELVSGSIRRFTLPQRRQTQTDRQIGPMRVVFVDQIDLPRSMPVFQLVFALYRGLHFAKQFEMHEAVDRIFRGMSGHRFVPMLPHATNKVRGHANVERAVQLARKDVDAGLFVLSHLWNLAAKWTLKQVQGDEILEIFCTTRCHPELVSGSIGRFAQVGATGAKALVL